MAPRLKRQHAAWIGRAILLWLLLGAIAPIKHRLYPMTAQKVQTVKPHVCVHTDLINEVEEWKIRESLSLVREMGAQTIVEFFPWSYIESTEGQFNWSQADRIIRHAENQGIHIIARLGLVPAWARPKDTTPNFLTEDAFADYAHYAEQFAARYGNTVQHIIIWNEPNLAFEWGFQPVDPQQYVKLLKTVYPLVKIRHPQVTILAGALAPTLEPEGSPYGLDDLLYLQAMLDAGAADYFDALAVHTYGFTEAPSNTPTASDLNYRRAELLHALLDGYGLDKTPVYITETGWNDNSRWTRGVRPSQRIAYTLEALTWTEENWPWAQTACLWIFRYPRPQHTYRDNFTLVTPEFQRKPIYDAIQAYARGWPQQEALWLPPPETS